jgi:hypothetical protein
VTGSGQAGCTIEPEKVWATTVSLGAGLTATELDGGRIALGVVVGGRPEVVVFDGSGQGSEVTVQLKKELSTPPTKEQGTRELHRVTPALGSGNEVIAFVDYSETGDDRRLVSCGPSDSNEELLAFEGKPLLASDQDRAADAPKPAPPAGAPKGGTSAPKSAGAAKALAPSAPGRGAGAKAAPVLHAADSKARGPAASPEHKPAAASAPPPAKGPASAGKGRPKGDKVRELRDCRTLVDRGGAHAWAVGSELVGQPLDDGDTDFAMVFFAEQEHGRGRFDLNTTPLGKTPSKPPVFEGPVAYDLGRGSFALAARFRGSLFAWLLDASKHARGPMRVYGGGFPGLPRFAPFGTESDLFLVLGTNDGRRLPRAVRVASGATELPADLTAIGVAEPALTGSLSGTALGSRRFVSYLADEKTRRLMLVGVDVGLGAMGTPVAVDAGVYDAQIFPLADGRLLVTYLREGVGGRVDLVSRAATCG